MNAVTSRIGYLKDLVSILRDLCNIKNSSFAHLFEYFYKKSGDNFMSSFYRKENITVCAKQGGKLEAIAEFTLSYSAMTTWDGKPISITPKAHIIMVHVSQLLDRRGDGKGLGYFSEQSFESVDADYKLDWESVKLEIDHPDYLATFFDCFVCWNARHL